MFIQPIKPRPVNIQGFEHYLISFWGGKLFNTRTGRSPKGWLNLQRYRRVKLINGEDFSNQYIHRLVGLTWNYNSDPEKKNEVNHLDKIRDSNSSPNLAWVTHSENMAYIKCELLVEQYEIAPF